MDKKYKQIILAILVVIVFLHAFDQRIVIKHYTLVGNSLSESQKLRIVQLSDLHSTTYGEKQKKLINKVKSQKPNLIVLSGDILDDYVPNKPVKYLLEGIVNLAPTYYVVGNHEIWSNDLSSKLDLLKAAGVVVLRDQDDLVKINGVNIHIIGLDDPYSNGFLSDLNKKKLNLSYDNEPNDLKIMLSHRAELHQIYKGFSPDLSFSGHAHGGQVRIPFLMNGLLAPDQGWFPKYAGGIYVFENYTHIVSRGLSINPRLPRVFNRPEIVVVDMVSK
jgi:predicted MPP superfamily phosphohydrolase